MDAGAARDLAQQVAEVALPMGLIANNRVAFNQAVGTTAIALGPLPDADDHLVRTRDDDSVELQLLTAAGLYTAIVNEAGEGAAGLAVSVRARRLDDPRAVVRFDQSGLRDVNRGPGFYRAWAFDFGDGDPVEIRGTVYEDALDPVDEHERFAQALHSRFSTLGIERLRRLLGGAD